MESEACKRLTEILKFYNAILVSPLESEPLDRTNIPYLCGDFRLVIRRGEANDDGGGGRGAY
jgi:hypothetical protein